MPPADPDAGGGSPSSTDAATGGYNPGEPMGRPDAGADRRGSPDGSGPASTRPIRTKLGGGGGCACSVGDEDPGTSAGAPLMLVVGGFVLVARRRRRR
jgi:MYXO-CTERM domain-containing protein